jgi:cell division protein ZapB
MKEKKIIRLLSGIIIVIIIGLAYFIYQNNENEKIKMMQEKELDNVYLELDSISNVLSEKILTISQLGGDIDSLLVLKENLEIEKKEFRTRAYAQINRLQGKVDGYRELLLAQDEEIERLKKVNEQLFEENKEQKIEINNLNSTISNINQSNKKLEEKIEVASRLEILDFEVIGIFRNGSEKKNSFRNRSLDRLSINLTLNENDLAKIEVVDVYISIEKPNGEIIYDISKGSGTFTYEKREEFYTIKEGVLVDRSKKELSINYTKNQEFDKGLHKVHFYTNEYKIGSGEFLIK